MIKDLVPFPGREVAYRRKFLENREEHLFHGLFPIETSHLVSVTFRSATCLFALFQSRIDTVASNA
jgi:hypothetical protein